ncbi:CD63 antigen-like isoform X2 [Acanthaster planci]|uniref:Tetraspanin n=1 Tax=Acanthaster planci TaxID=133434 RepID=A0A8B7XPZ4_ACAPL|nr:CD63 antigen-like isoform X2 [Acanthaster planci]
MVAGCGAKISKMILFVFNFLLWLVGIVLIGLGGFVVARPGTYGNFFGDSTNLLNVASGVVIAVGCLVFLVAFAGCCGAMKESACLLKIYIAVVVVLVILEIVGGILALVFRENIESTLAEVLSDQMATYEKYDASANNLVDTVQKGFKCCGNSTYESWRGSKFQLMNPGKFVPLSCCLDEKDTTCNNGNALNTDINDKAKIHNGGCTSQIVQFVKDNFLIIGAVALGMVAAEILAMIFACCVIAGINNGEYE